MLECWIGTKRVRAHQKLSGQAAELSQLWTLAVLGRGFQSLDFAEFLAVSLAGKTALEA